MYCWPAGRQEEDPAQLTKRDLLGLDRGLIRIVDPPAVVLPSAPDQWVEYPRWLDDDYGLAPHNYL